MARPVVWSLLFRLLFCSCALLCVHGGPYLCRSNMLPHAIPGTPGNPTSMHCRQNTYSSRFSLFCLLLLKTRQSYHIFHWCLNWISFFVQLCPESLTYRMIGGWNSSVTFKTKTFCPSLRWDTFALCAWRERLCCHDIWRRPSLSKWIWFYLLSANDFLQILLNVTFKYEA